MEYPHGFYVYAYLRAHDSGDGKWLAQMPYYVGKGKGGRAWQVHSPIPRPKDSGDIVILSSGLAEVEAHGLEMQAIKRLGRCNVGTGCLRNFTDGGEGQSGRLISQETRARLRQRFSGEKSNFYGKPAWNRGMPSNLGRKTKPESLEKLKLSRRGLKTAKASSPYHGVHWLKNKCRWRAYVRVNNKSNPLGTSRDPIICARLYDRYVRQNHLDRPLNFPDLPMIADQPITKRENRAPRTRSWPREKRHGSSSPHYGVLWLKSRRTWKVRVFFQGRDRYIGHSRDPIIAAQMYDSFVIENGLNRRLNFPGQASAGSRKATNPGQYSAVQEQQKTPENLVLP